jgi:hypothetical protein
MRSYQFYGIFARNAKRIYEIVPESSQNFCCNCQGHTSVNLPHQSAKWRCDVNTHRFFMSALLTLLSKPFKCFTRLLNILQARQQFLNSIHVSRPVKCQMMTTNIQGNQVPTIWQKTRKKFENLPTKTSDKQSMNSQTLVGYLMKFARRRYQNIWTCTAVSCSLFPGFWQMISL